jgi:hypothetical protein
MGRYTVLSRLGSQDSGIVPPRGGITPNGTTVEHEQMREFRLKVEAHDELGEKKANFQIRPRWFKMRVENDNGNEHELSIPTTLVEDTDAINFRVSGSNIEFPVRGVVRSDRRSSSSPWSCSKRSPIFR